MMKWHRTNLVAAIATTAFVAATAGCGASHSGGEAVGTISVDLVTMGPNGDKYQLLPTVFALTSTTNPGATLQVSFDSSTTQTTDTFSLPADTYTGQLLGGPPFQLLDVTTGQTVTANLLDMEPLNVTISVGQTTALTFHFNVPSIGPVTFGTGSLQTTIAVGSTSGAPTAGSLAASTDASFLLTQGFQPIQNLITQSVSPDVAFPATKFSLGPWTPNVDAVCATATFPPGYLPLVTLQNPGMSTGIVDLIREAMAPGGTAIVCLGDANFAPGIANPVLVEFDRTGAPTTPSVTSALATYVGTPSFGFSLLGQATLPATDPPAYDGTVASFTDFASSLTMTVAATTLYFDSDKSDAVIATNDPTLASTLTFQLTP
jgi:hypothetical protein